MQNEEMALAPILECSQPAQIRHNLMDLSAALLRITDTVSALPRTLENIAEVKQARANLNKYLESLEVQRKNAKAEAMAAYNQAEAIYNDRVKAPIKKAEALCKAFVDDVEGAAKKECEDGLREYFAELCRTKGIYWLQFERVGIKVDMATAKQKEPRKAMERIKTFVDAVDQTLRTISGMENSNEILEEYTRTLDLERAVANVNSRKAAQKIAEQNRARWQAVQDEKQQNTAVIEKAAPDVGRVVRTEPLVKEFRVVFAATAPRPMLQELIEFYNSHNIKIQEVTENG